MREESEERERKKAKTRKDEQSILNVWLTTLDHVTGARLSWTNKSDEVPDSS